MATSLSTTSSDSDRDPLEVLFSEYLERNRRGETVDIVTFAQLYPEFAEEIQELFPTLETLEGLRTDKVSSKSSKSFQEFDASTGMKLGDYRLIREIGAGGMGIVYEAIQESVQRRVALKVLPREFNNNPVRRTRFLQEARMVARMAYRNIVPVIDFGESDGRCYFAMRLIEGVGLDWIILRLAENPHPLTSTEALNHFREQGIPLASREESENSDDDSLASEFHLLQQLQKQPPEAASKWILRRDSWKQIVRIGIQAAKALDHAHQAGILHRDIKPGNLLLDEEGIVWITDFGLAKSEQELSLTGDNDVVGTLRYISPERFRGKMDARSDLYALGLTLLELCIQRPAFQQSSRSELIRNIIEGTIPSPRHVNPAIPEALEIILQKATARKPSQRYPSASAMIEDLRAFSKGIQIKPISIPTPAQSRKRTAKKPWTLILSMVCLLQFVALWNSTTATTVWEGEPETQAVLQADLWRRLQSVDKLYEQILRRTLATDLQDLKLVKPLPQYTTSRESAESLQELYVQMAIEARYFSLSESKSDIELRLKLMGQLLK